MKNRKVLKNIYLVLFALIFTVFTACKQNIAVSDNNTVDLNKALISFEFLDEERTAVPDIDINPEDFTSFKLSIFNSENESVYSDNWINYEDFMEAKIELAISEYTFLLNTENDKVQYRAQTKVKLVPGINTINLTLKMYKLNYSKNKTDDLSSALDLTYYYSSEEYGEITEDMYEFYNLGTNKLANEEITFTKGKGTGEYEGLNYIRFTSDSLNENVFYLGFFIYTKNGERRYMVDYVDYVYLLRGYTTNQIYTIENLFPMYKVNFEIGEGATIDLEKDEDFYVLSSGYDLPNALKVKREGYVFGGWYLDDKFSQKAENWTYYEKSGDITVYAKWDKEVEQKKDETEHLTVEYLEDDGVLVTLKNEGSGNWDNVQIINLDTNITATLPDDSCIPEYDCDTQFIFRMVKPNVTNHFALQYYDYDKRIEYTELAYCLAGTGNLSDLTIPDNYFETTKLELSSTSDRTFKPNADSYDEIFKDTSKFDQIYMNITFSTDYFDIESEEIATMKMPYYLSNSFLNEHPYYVDNCMEIFEYWYEEKASYSDMWNDFVDGKLTFDNAMNKNIYEMLLPSVYEILKQNGEWDAYGNIVFVYTETEPDCFAPYYFINDKIVSEKAKFATEKYFDISFVTNCEDKLQPLTVDKFNNPYLLEIMYSLPTASDMPIMQNEHPFLGWYTDEACTTPVDITKLTADTTLYGLWSKDKYIYNGLVSITEVNSSQKITFNVEKDKFYRIQYADNFNGEDAYESDYKIDVKADVYDSQERYIIDTVDSAYENCIYVRAFEDDEITIEISEYYDEDTGDCYLWISTAEEENVPCYTLTLDCSPYEETKEIKVPENTYVYSEWLPVFSSNGYVVSGWVEYSGASFGEYCYMIDYSYTLYPVMKKACKVNFVTNVEGLNLEPVLLPIDGWGGDYCLYMDGNYYALYGNTEYPAPKNGTRAFLGWFKDTTDEYDSNYTIYLDSEDQEEISIYAKWSDPAVTTHKVTLNYCDGSEPVEFYLPENTIIKNCSSFKYTDDTDKYYYVEIDSREEGDKYLFGLYFDEEYTDPAYNTIWPKNKLITEDCELYVKYSKKQFQIELDANGGIFEDKGDNYKYLTCYEGSYIDNNYVIIGMGNSKNILDYQPTREDYAFTGFYFDKACKKPCTVNTPFTEAMTLYAGWEYIE